MTSLKPTNGYLTNFLYHNRDRSDQRSHSTTREKRKRTESYEEEERSETELTNSSSSETESEDWSYINEKDKRELQRALKQQYPQHFKDSIDCEPDSDDSYYYQQSPEMDRKHLSENEIDETRQEILEQLV